MPASHMTAWLPTIVAVVSLILTAMLWIFQWPQQTRQQMRLMQLQLMRESAAELTAELNSSWLILIDVESAIVATLAVWELASPPSRRKLVTRVIDSIQHYVNPDQPALYWREHILSHPVVFADMTSVAHEICAHDSRLTDYLFDLQSLLQNFTDGATDIPDSLVFDRLRQINSFCLDVRTLLGALVRGIDLVVEHKVFGRKFVPLNDEKKGLRITYGSPWVIQGAPRIPDYQPVSTTERIERLRSSA